MKKLALFLCFFILIPFIQAQSSYNFLTKGLADTLYCALGSCGGDNSSNQFNITSNKLYPTVSSNYLTARNYFYTCGSNLGNCFTTYHTNDKSYLYSYGSNMYELVLTQNNRVGLNKDNPYHTLDVGGDANIDNSLTVQQSITTNTNFIAQGHTGLTDQTNYFWHRGICSGNYFQSGDCKGTYSCGSAGTSTDCSNCGGSWDYTGCGGSSTYDCGSIPYDYDCNTQNLYSWHWSPCSWNYGTSHCDNVDCGSLDSGQCGTMESNSYGCYQQHYCNGAGAYGGDCTVIGDYNTCHTFSPWGCYMTNSGDCSLIPFANCGSYVPCDNTQRVECRPQFYGGIPDNCY